MLLASGASTWAQMPTPALDTLVMTTGERRPAKILSLDAQGFSVEVVLAPGQGSGTMRIPRGSVSQVEFAPDPARDNLIAKATSTQLASVAALWQKWEPFLNIPRSPAPKIGQRYTALLLESGDAAQAQKALALSQRLEKEGWNAEDRALAKQGRLRGMVAAGQADAAVAEAREIVKTASGEEAVEARYILAVANDHLLRTLLEENPRWEEDDRIRPERARLLNDALDDYLYPSLFAGAVAEPSARGLWGAIGIYKLTGEKELARESAQDIVTLYAGTHYAKLAQDYLTSLPKEPKPPSGAAVADPLALSADKTKHETKK